MKKSPSRQDRRDAFTLLEILIAMGIFVILGAALVTILRQGLRLWRTGEEAMRSHETAHFILSQMREDLANTFTGTGGAFQVEFFCEFEPRNEERGVQRQVLRFVRTRKGESQHPIASLGGTSLAGDAHYDHFDDAAEMAAARLKAGTGLEEVAYLMDPDPDSTLLRRGVRSPPWSIGSLLRGRAGQDVVEQCQRLADGVIHLEFRFWTQYTKTWNEDFYPVPFPHDEETASGPAFEWDSTRGAFVPEEDKITKSFKMHIGPTSFMDPRDDIYPRQVMVVLVMEADMGVTLAQGINEEDTRISLDGASKIPEEGPRYVRIDREWIRYTRLEDGRLILEEPVGASGRGMRGTSAASHARGAAVQVGRTFTMVVPIPSFRDNWNR